MKVSLDAKAGAVSVSNERSARDMAPEASEGWMGFRVEGQGLGGLEARVKV